MSLVAAPCAWCNGSGRNTKQDKNDDPCPICGGFGSVLAAAGSDGKAVKCKWCANERGIEPQPPPEEELKAAGVELPLPCHCCSGGGWSYPDVFWWRRRNEIEAKIMATEQQARAKQGGLVVPELVPPKNVPGVTR